MKTDEIREMLTDAGATVHFRPVSHLDLADIPAQVVKEFQAAGRRVKPPRYHVEGPAADEYLDFDEVSIQGERATDEDRAAWAEHLATLALLKFAIRFRQGRFLLEEGIVEEGPDEGLEAWIAERRRLGKLAPDDDAEDFQREARWCWIERGLLLTREDFTRAIGAISLLSAKGVRAGLLEAARHNFRLALEGDYAAGGLGEAAAAAGVVDGQPEGDGGAGGEVVGAGEGPPDVGRD